MLGLVLPQLVAKTAGEMALRWPRLGFSSHFLQPIYLSISAENERLAPQPIYLSLEISSAFKMWSLSPEKKRNPGFAIHCWFSPQL